jgi:predicted Rossmann fold flavoprotein
MIVGGGAAGIFAAITCAEQAPGIQVTVLEKSAEFLSKVLISGGGRCNVTHACYDPVALSEFYPRGGKELIGAFHRFQPRDTIEWFENRGVRLKTEEDGRIFPVTDSSRTIVDCLLTAAKRARVRLLSGAAAEKVEPFSGGFKLTLGNGEVQSCRFLMLAMGGCRAPAMGKLAVDCGHRLVPPVPSLFAFHSRAPWLTPLAGIAVGDTSVSVPGSHRGRGPLLITHTGISGPAVLRASAWGARDLHALNYNFDAQVNWLAHLTVEQIAVALKELQVRHPAKRVANTPLPGLPSRLWEAITRSAEINLLKRWADFSRADQQRLLRQLTACVLPVHGKSLNKDEFVTCGGVPLKAVNFKKMESRICPGLYFGGELLDIDGITGGFNFQAAWTTGWIAGKAMASAAALPGTDRDFAGLQPV